MTNTTITLNNGVEMPAVGLGVLQSEGHQAIDSVMTALRAGYRLIDTAAAYCNEREVGEASASRASTGRRSSSRRSCG